MKKLVLPCLVIVMGLALTVSTRAGNLDPSWGPQSGSGMYTLSEVYYFLMEGREGSIAASFQEPTAGPGSTMMDTKLIYDDIKAELDGCDAQPGDVLSGTTFFNTDTSAWGVQLGTVETRTWTSSTTAYDAGFYAQTDLNVVDYDLADVNIKAGKVIFGVLGTYSGLPKTGQFISYSNYDDVWYANPAGDDIGNPQGLGTWANYTADGGRFTIQTSGLPGGVVLDNAMGLSWATGTDGAGCNFGDQTDWYSAVTWARNLDFANQTDWRLPNSIELYTLVDRSTEYPAIDTKFFPNTLSVYYWSSTTYAGQANVAWYVLFNGGYVDTRLKSYVSYVRAVRGGE